MRLTWKAVTGLGALLGVLFVGGSAVGAQDDCGGYLQPPCAETERITFDYPGTVTAGGSIAIDGRISEIQPTASRASDDTVEFTIAERAIGSTTVAADGTFRGTFTVPSVAAGDYEITATSGTLVARGPITVVVGGSGGGGNNNNGNSANSGSGPLARTGLDATPLVTLGLAVVVLGAAAVYGSKRRRTA